MPKILSKINRHLICHLFTSKRFIYQFFNFFKRIGFLYDFLFVIKILKAFRFFLWRASSKGAKIRSGLDEKNSPKIFKEAVLRAVYFTGFISFSDETMTLSRNPTSRTVCTTGRVGFSSTTGKGITFFFFGIFGKFEKSIIWLAPASDVSTDSIVRKASFFIGLILWLII
jgi:hypothetical protein